MLEHVNKTINICEEVKYNDDEKLEKLKLVHAELKDDYLLQHLRRSLSPATPCHYLIYLVVTCYTSSTCLRGRMANALGRHVQ